MADNDRVEEEAMEARTHGDYEVDGRTVGIPEHW